MTTVLKSLATINYQNVFHGIEKSRVINSVSIIYIMIEERREMMRKTRDGEEKVDMTEGMIDVD